MASILKIGNSFRAQVRRKGIKEVKTFDSLKEAEEWASGIEANIKRGAHVSTSEAESTLFHEACKKYEQNILPSLKGRISDKSRLGTIVKELGGRPLAALNNKDLNSYKAKRLKVVGPQSVKHELTLIIRVLKACTIEWGIVLPHGIPEVKKPKSPRGRERRVSEPEIQAILAASNSSELKLIVRFAIETAMRRSEITSIKLSDVKFHKPSVLLKDTKNSESREVPLSKQALEIIKSRLNINNGPIFRMKSDSVTQGFDRAVKRAREKYLATSVEGQEDEYLLDIHFHDLRHEAITRMALKVTNMLNLAKITGHKDVNMLRRYYHPDMEDLAKLLN